MSKVIVNDKEVQPGKKVKLDKHMLPSQIKELLKEKSKEQRGQ